MKVLIVSGFFYEQKGASIWLKNLISALEKQGVDVEVVTWERPHSLIGRFNNMYVVNRFDKFDFLDAMLGEYITQRRVYKVVNKKLKSDDIDIVHTGGIFDSYLYLGKINKKKTKVVMTVHGNHLLEIKTWFHGPRRKYYLKLYDFIERKNFEVPDAFVSVSEYNVEMIKKRWGYLREQGLINKNKRPLFLSILNGVNTNEFKPIIKNSSKKENTFKVISVGNLNSYKGYPYLFEAAKVLNGINFIVIGSGPLESKLKKIAPTNVEFIGTVNNNELPSWYNSSDIFCLPSVLESFPIVLLEAMACGLPVIATSIVGIPEIVNDEENGFLIKPRDSDELIEAILRLKGSPELMERMAENNRRKMLSKYSWDTIAKDYIKLYEQLGS
jgi:glycosyltransferase involved in cell wall biosynthesis